MFGISVSGIKNSQKHLDVTSNNIANANSYGFKKSRAEFSDMYANSLYTNSKTSVGLGVQNQVVSQQFVQGPLSGETGNGLDMAIQGNGFFVLSGNLNSQSHTYTRNGAFHTNPDGYIVNAIDDYLQGWDVNPDGTTSSLDLNATHPIRIPSDTGEPHESNAISIGVNLPADSKTVSPVTPVDDGNGNLTVNWGGSTVDVTNDEITYSRPLPSNPDVHQYFSKFNPKDSTTYNNSTSQTIHDSLGRAHTLTYYMLNMGAAGKDAPVNNQSTWVVIPFVDGVPVDVAPSGDQNPTLISTVEGVNAGSNYFGFRVNFDNNGQMISDSTIPANVSFAQNDENEGAVKSLRQSLLGSFNVDNGDGTFGYTNGIEVGVVDTTFGGTIGMGGAANVSNANTENSGTLYSAAGLGSNTAQRLLLDFNATQFGSSAFNVTVAPTNDGYATGRLTSVSIDENGVIYGEYSNGSLQAIAKVAMADFTNTQGLTKKGDTQWAESMDSGPAIACEANTGSTGYIKGSNLELSNVDLTSELVELITAQRNYQANAQSLQVQNTVMDSILNVR